MKEFKMFNGLISLKVFENSYTLVEGDLVLLRKTWKDDTFWGKLKVELKGGVKGKIYEDDEKWAIAQYNGGWEFSSLEREELFSCVDCRLVCETAFRNLYEMLRKPRSRSFWNGVEEEYLREILLRNKGRLEGGYFHTLDKTREGVIECVVVDPILFSGGMEATRIWVYPGDPLYPYMETILLGKEEKKRKIETEGKFLYTERRRLYKDEYLIVNIYEYEGELVEIEGAIYDDA